MNVIKAVKGISAIVGTKTEEHSPEICLGLGIAGMVAATVFACKSTIKATKIVEEAKDDLNTIKEAEEYGATYDADNNEIEYTKEDATKDRAIVITRTAIEISKAYGPAVILTAAGIALLLKGHNILRKRNIALIAAYKSIDEAYRNYQEKVKAYLGESTARNLKYGLTEKEISVDTGKKNKDGSAKTKKQKKLIYDGADPSTFSPYARFFQEGCKGWDPDPQYSLMYLLKLQRWMNDRLQLEKVVTLNDVYDELGIPRTQQGQIVGWSLLKSKKDGYIDFGIYNDAYTPNRDFVDGYENVILLDFNVDGPVYGDLPDNKQIEEGEDGSI